MFKYPGAIGYCILLLLFLNDAEITVRVAINASFRLHIFQKTLDSPISCTLISPLNVTTDIPLNYQNVDSQTEDKKILPLGNNQCGARIHNATSSDAGRWTLTVSNAEESTTEVFRIFTVTLETPINRTSTAIIGESRSNILCGPSNILYCELKDPLGNLAPLSSRTRCETQLEVVKATDFGIWTCIVGVTGSTTEIHATHTLNIGDPTEEVVIFRNETSFGQVISWQVHRIIPAASWCRAFPPNGESILVAPGLEVKKYASVGTDLTENKCGLLINGEFPKEYHGTWRLEMGLTSGRMIGGFIEMPEGQIPGSDAINEASPKKPLLINVAAGKSFAITCQTKYPAGYCWIKGPNGQMITSTEELNLGRCSHVINSAVKKEHAGNWTCNMAHINGGHEEHLVTDVNVLETLYQAVNPEITARRGDNIVIACKSVLDSPLQYCRFVRPDGVGLGVTPGMKPSGRYSYEGRGLDHGYCGLAISPVEAVDFGEWTCVSRSRFHTWETENFDTSVLRATETSAASVIGLTMGAVLLVVILGGVITLRYRSKRARNSTAALIVGYNNQ